MTERTADTAEGVRQGVPGSAGAAQAADRRALGADVAADVRRGRQAFLLRFSDALRAEPNADAVAHLAIRLLAYELDVDRCYVATLHLEEDRADITHGFSRLGAPPLPLSLRMSDFPTVVGQAFLRSVVLPDIARQPGLDERDRKSFAAIEFGAVMAGVVRRGVDHPVWALAAVSKVPREWTREEVALVEEATERTWIALERVRAQNALAASEHKYRGLFETMDEGFCIIEKAAVPLDAPSDYRWVEVNPAFQRLTRVDEAVGRSLRGAFGADAARTIEMYDHVLDSGQSVRFERTMSDPWRVFEVHAFRLGDEDSRTVAVLFQDATQRRQSERATVRLASIVDSSDDAIVSKGLDGVVRTWNAAAERLFGYSAAEAIGRPITELIIPDDRQNEEADILRRLARGETIDHFETMRQRKDGSMVEISVTISPLHAHGRIIGASKIARDISVRRRAERALRDSEEKYRTLFNSIDAGFILLELVRDAQGTVVDYRVVDANPVAAAMVGARDLVGRRAHEVLPELKRKWFDVLGEVASSGVSQRFLEQASHTGDRWYDCHISPVGQSGARLIAVVANDVTERRRAAERQQVLIAELQHRTRNLIGVVRAIATQTARSSASLDSFAEEFDGRLRALAGVQGLLSRSGREPITLGALVAMELKALGADVDAGRIHVDGPPVRIRDGIAQTLALALHELATNARKYGALAGADGRLQVNWSVSEPSAGPRLRIEWSECGIETGVRAADQPGGYGRKLIEQALPYALDASTQYALAGDTLHCSIELPLQPA